MRVRQPLPYLLAAALLGFAVPSAAGTDGAWTDQFGTARPEEAEGVALGPSGDVFVAGWTDGTLGGQATAGGVDAFVRRYDAGGVEQWTRQFGSWERDFARELAVDRVGNVVVVGETEGTLPGLHSSGGRDAFVRKYDPSGTELWTRQVGGGGGEGAWGVALDAAGNAYVSGSTRAAMPGQASAGDWDAFLMKLSPAGEALWLRQFGSGYDDGSASVAVSPDGHAWITGSTNGSLTGRPPAGGYDGYVRLYDPQGTERWTDQFGTAGDDFAVDVAVDRAGRVFVTGSTDRALPGQASSGGTDAFVRFYGGEGQLLWLTQFGTGRTDDGWAIATDGDGSAYVAGTTEERLPGQRWSGEADIFVRKYSASGTELWTRQHGGPNRDLVFGLALDAGDRPHLAGGTWGALPGEKPSGGGRDAYALRLG